MSFILQLGLKSMGVPLVFYVGTAAAATIEIDLRQGALKHDAEWKVISTLVMVKNRVKQSLRLFFY